MKTPTIGLAVLSWRGADSLNSTLESYSKAELFSLFDEVVVFLPDPDKKVLEVAKKYPVTIRTAPENLGILENIAATAECLSTDFLLFMENDCPIIETRDEAAKQISKSLKMLERDEVIMSRLRSVRLPGEDFDGLRKYRALYKSSLTSYLKRIFRPGKVKRLSGYARYDGPDSIRRHGGAFEDLGDNYYLVDCARGVKTKRGANKLPNLEIELNKGRFWRNSGWKILCGPGLFTHQRHEDRGY